MLTGKDCQQPQIVVYIHRTSLPWQTVKKKKKNLESISCFSTH